MPVIRCADCGAENDSDAVFCVACDRYLAWDNEGGRTQLDRPRTVLRPPPVTFVKAETSAPPEPAPPAAPIEPAPAAPAAAPRPEPVTEVAGVLAAIGTSQQLAQTHGRNDLDEHLRQTEARLARQPITVTVVGEFKRGKSTLINALLQLDVCPVDADVVTAVPTTIRWAPTTRVSTFYLDEEGTRLEERPVPAADLRQWVTEEADPADPHRERAVEVGVRHRMLETGLRLVDTPGVGGLDSAHGFLTLGALRWAQGVLFVTDAAQELTGPELSFLTTAVERCPLAALVVTKTDLYPQWRRIVELDRGHLARAGLDLPVIAVSSFLRLRAAQDKRPGARAQLDAESGFADLVRFLAADVVAPMRAAAAKNAAQEVEFVAAQLEQQAAAEEAVIAAPERREQVVAELDQIEAKAARLTNPTATWQQVLADGIQDLFADVEHDLQGRLRTVLADAEQIIEQGDPLATWADTEVWLRRQVAIVTEQNRDLLTDRARALAEEVADQFDMAAGAELSLALATDEQAVSAVKLASRASLAMPGGKLAPVMMAARTSIYLPMVAASVALSMIPGVLVVQLAIGGIAAGLGAGIGTKIIRDERVRQRTYRQQQAKAAVRRFVDEVAFVMNKQTRDGLRATQRQLRDEFQQRAMLLQASASAAVAAARDVAALDGDELAARRRALADQQASLARVRAAAREVAAG